MNKINRYAAPRDGHHKRSLDFFIEQLTLIIKQN